jgi:hypothetical protein
MRTCADLPRKRRVLWRPQTSPLRPAGRADGVEPVVGSTRIALDFFSEAASGEAAANLTFEAPLDRSDPAKLTE